MPTKAMPGKWSPAQGTATRAVPASGMPSVRRRATRTRTKGTPSRPMPTKKALRRSGLYVTLTGVALVLLFPFYWTLVSSLKPAAEQARFPPTFWPGHLQWTNFLDAWTSQPFTQYLLNSLFVTTMSVLGVTVSSALVAYGFARYEFRGKNVMFVVLLATMIIPWNVLVVPLYMEYSFLGWINTYLPLIMPSFLGVPFYIYLLTQFLRSIPRDFEEAARLDGANHFQIFYWIFLPMMRPQLVLTGILYMLIVWNDFLGPLVFLNDTTKFTLPVGLSFFKSSQLIDTTSMLAISVVMIVPPLVAFFFGQRYILGNDAQSGVKG